MIADLDEIVKKMVVDMKMVMLCGYASVSEKVNTQVGIGGVDIVTEEAR